MTNLSPNERFSSLSPRQKEVLQLVCQGYKYKDIASTLFITTSAVKAHMRQIYIKFDLMHLDRDERVYIIRSTYCPMFDQVSADTPDESIQIIDPEPEPEPVTQEEDEMLEADQVALMKIYRPGQKPVAPPGPRERRPRPILGCIRFFGMLLLLGLAALGVFFIWKIIQNGGSDLIPEISIGEVGSELGISNLGSKTYEVGEWHQENELWM